jgi:hypothetical protein
VDVSAGLAAGRAGAGRDGRVVIPLARAEAHRQPRPSLTPSLPPLARRASLGRARSGPIVASQWDPIHKEAPEFVEQSTEQEILVTGIKVIDLIEPYPKGGKIGLFGGAGVGKTVRRDAARGVLGRARRSRQRQRPTRDRPCHGPCRPTPRATDHAAR